jgi:hypothetical protein
LTEDQRAELSKQIFIVGQEEQERKAERKLRH